MTPITQSLSTQPVFAGVVYDPNASVKAEFGRLIHAAIINRSFRESLLSNPERSIDNGYCGETFHFPVELKERISSIRVSSLEEFSAQVLQVVDAPCLTKLPVMQYQ